MEIQFLLGFFCELMGLFIHEIFSEKVITSLFDLLKYFITCLVVIYILTVLVVPSIIIILLLFLLSYHSQDVKHLFWEYINKSKEIPTIDLKQLKDHKIKNIYLRRINIPKFLTPICYAFSCLVTEILYFSLIFEIEDSNGITKFIRIERGNKEYVGKNYSLEIPDGTFTINIDKDEKLNEFIEKYQDIWYSEFSPNSSNCKSLIQNILKNFGKENDVDNLLISEPFCILKFLKF